MSRRLCQFAEAGVRRPRGRAGGLKCSIRRRHAGTCRTGVSGNGSSSRHRRTGSPRWSGCRMTCRFAADDVDCVKPGTLGSQVSLRWGLGVDCVNWRGRRDSSLSVSRLGRVRHARRRRAGRCPTTTLPKVSKVVWRPSRPTTRPAETAGTETSVRDDVEADMTLRDARSGSPRRARAGRRGTRRRSRCRRRSSRRGRSALESRRRGDDDQDHARGEGDRAGARADPRCGPAEQQLRGGRRARERDDADTGHDHVRACRTDAPRARGRARRRGRRSTRRRGPRGRRGGTARRAAGGTARPLEGQAEGSARSPAPASSRRPAKAIANRPSRTR